MKTTHLINWLRHDPSEQDKVPIMCDHIGLGATNTLLFHLVPSERISKPFDSTWTLASGAISARWLSLSL